MYLAFSDLVNPGGIHMRRSFYAHLNARKKRLLALACPSVRPSVVVELGFHWLDFREIWYWELLLKSVERVQVWLKSVRYIWHFTWRPNFYYYEIFYSLSHVAAQVIVKYKGNILFSLHGDSVYFNNTKNALLLEAVIQTLCCIVIVMHGSTMHRKRTFFSFFF